MENNERNTRTHGDPIPEEVARWMRDRGIDVQALLSPEPLLREHKDGGRRKRFEELSSFEPKRGKAELTQVGETTGDNYPIYQEDIDMLRKSLPLVKRILDTQKRREGIPTTVDHLLTGPDTTENILEIDGTGMRTAGKYTPGKDYIRGTLDPVPDGVGTRIPWTGWLPEECGGGASRDEEHSRDYYGYSNIIRRMDDTHARKNSDYGDAAYQGYKELGDAYYIVQLHNKLSRLKSLTIQNRKQQVRDESIDDTLMDMANYAVMFIESRHRDD